MVQFIENKGQFPEHVDYKLALKAGDIFFEGNKITYQLYEKGKISSYGHGLTNDSSDISSSLLTIDNSITTGSVTSGCLRPIHNNTSNSTA